MDREATTSSPLASASQEKVLENTRWQPTLLSLFIGLGILFFSYFHTAIETILVWNDSSHYRPSWLVLPTIVLLLFFSRKELRPIIPRVSWHGILYGLVFSILWIVSDLINVSVLRQLALLGIICSLVLTAVGGNIFRVLFPYLALLLLTVPIWEALLPGLKLFAVQFVGIYTKIVDIPLTTDGFALFVGSNRYVIIDYCAGLSYVLVGLLIGASYALLIYRSYLKILLISLAGGCVAILANGIRISSIISFEYFTGIDLDNYHSLFDLPVIIPCFAAFFYILSKLKPDILSHSTPPKRLKGDISTFYSFALVIVTAVIFSIGPIYIDKIAVNSEHLSSLSIEQKIGRWSRSEKIVNWHPKIRSNSVEEDQGFYFLGETEVLIYVAEPRRIDVKISGQAINLTDKDWMNYSHPHSETFCVHDRCHSYGYSSSALKASDRIRHIYYGYVVNGMMTDSTLNYRVHRAFSNLNGKGLSARYIAIVFEGETGLSQNTLAPIFHHLIPFKIKE